MTKLLIADDDPNFLELYQMALKREGFQVLAANSGTVAFEILAREKPDVLVLDIMLPGMDGHSLALKLSKDAHLSKIPIVVITALPETHGLFEKFGQVKTVLKKPFEPNVLIQAIRNALNHHPKRDALNTVL